MVGFDWARWHGKRDRFFNDRDRDRAVSATNGAVHLEGDKPVDLGVDAERSSLWDVFVESCVHSDGDLFTPAQGAVVAPVLIRRRAPRGQSQGPLRARHTVDGAGEFLYILNNLRILIVYLLDNLKWPMTLTVYFEDFLSILKRRAFFLDLHAIV